MMTHEFRRKKNVIVRVTSEWNDDVKNTTGVANFKSLYRRPRAATVSPVVQHEQEHPRQGSTWTAEDHLTSNRLFLSYLASHPLQKLTVFNRFARNGLKLCWIIFIKSSSITQLYLKSNSHAESFNSALRTF